MRDFTLNTYKKLLTELIQARYGFVTVDGYMQNLVKKEKIIILRHDVDKKPLRSLKTAEMENELGVKGTYYFRVIKNELPGKVIECIAKMGHEIGYHYDDLNDAGGNVESALDLFQKNLAKLRELTPVKTACMHGSPLSRYDNKDLWENFNYRELGIVGEPYLDIDYNEVAYLTDTGRCWDGEKYSIRDKVEVQRTEDRISEATKSRGAVGDPPDLHLHSTADIICALNDKLLPDRILLTIHPQRWIDDYFLWTKELIWQKIKNPIKYLKLIKLKKISNK